MKNILIIIIALFMAPVSAKAQYLPSTPIGRQILDSTNPLVTANQTGCSASTSTATACADIMGYADPRWFGPATANICGSNFNTNSNINDDAPYMQLAANTGRDVGPLIHCKMASRVNATTDGQTFFGYNSGQRYQNNFMGSNYIFLPNDLGSNATTTNNCAFDTKGYDHVKLRNIAFKGNFSIVGSVGGCNSDITGTPHGIRAGRAAAFMDYENVSFNNMGSGIGAAMVGFFDPDPGNPGNNYGFNSPCTPSQAGTINTGSRADMYANVVQVQATNITTSGTCMGSLGNFSDARFINFFAASYTHNALSTLPGFAGTMVVAHPRFEFGGCGITALSLSYNQGAALNHDSPAGISITDVETDHTCGPALRFGPNSINFNVSNANLFAAYYQAKSWITEQAYISIVGARGGNFTNINTKRNGIDTPYVFSFKNGTDINSVVQTPDYINIGNSVAGVSGSGGFSGNWTTAYMLLTNLGNHINFHDISGWSDTPNNISATLGSAFTFDLAKGPLQYGTLSANTTPAWPSILSSSGIQMTFIGGAADYTVDMSATERPGGSDTSLTVPASTKSIVTCFPNSAITKWSCKIDKDVHS